MGFYFGGHGIRSFDPVAALGYLQTAINFAVYVYRHRNQIVGFLRRNGGIMLGGSTGAIYAVSFVVLFTTIGYLVLGALTFDFTKLVQIIILTAVTFVGYVYGLRTLKREWRSRPEPTPVGSD